MKRAFLLVALAACGEDKPTCEVPLAELPLEGEAIDPYALALPADCVEAGLRDLPGRWFVIDDTKIFSFSYPRYTGTCKEGFQQFAAADEDHDLADDGISRYTWSDGTRFFQRLEYRYTLPDMSVFNYVRATVTCVMPDDQLAVTTFTHQTDEDPVVTNAKGKRFERMDSLASGLELVGELGTIPDGTLIAGLNLVIDGTRAYIAGTLGFDVVDVSNPAAPVHLGHVKGNFNDVRVVHTGGLDVAIIASRGPDERTYFVDVSNPSALRIVSSIEYSHSLQVQTRGATTELYLANYEKYVPKYDITNPVAPVLLAAFPVPGPEGAVHDLTVDGDRLYANNTTAGFVAIDVTSNGTSTMLARTNAPYSHASWVGTAGGRQIVLHGDEGMTKSLDGGAFLRVLDGNLSDIGRYQTRKEVGIHNFEVHNDRAYIAYYQDGVRIVDLSNPTMPREIAHYNTWETSTAPGGAFEGALGIRLVDGLIYVADNLRGLLIFRETL
jgi:hypothetical protein